MKAVEFFETLGTTSSLTRSNMPEGVSVGTAVSVFTQLTFIRAASVFTNQHLALLRPSFPTNINHCCVRLYQPTFPAAASVFTNQDLALLCTSSTYQPLSLLSPSLPNQPLALLRPSLPNQHLTLLCLLYLIRILPVRLQFSPPAARLQ